MTDTTIPAPINRAVLDGMRDMLGERGPEVIGKIIGTYLTESPKLITTLREGLAESNADKLRDAAHGLKSSSANVGAAGLALLCEEVELMARSNDVESAPALIAKIETTYAAVAEALPQAFGA